MAHEIALAMLLGWAAISGAEPGEKVEAAIEVGSRWEPFFGTWLVEEARGAGLKLHAPRREEVVLRFDAPWEGSQSGYGNVFRDGDRLRMYYRGAEKREYTCYAESEDGIHWRKPNLGLVEFEGSRENNIILTDPRRKAFAISHCFFAFKDANPNAPADEKYKAITIDRFERPDGKAPKGLVGYVSPDGLRWKRLRESALITDGAFDSLNVAFWDTVGERYVCYFRHNRGGKKTIARAISSDFRSWSASEFLRFGETPLEHLYTNGITPYPRAPHLLVGLPMRFVREDRLVEGRMQRVEVSDAVFMASRNGLDWPREALMEAFLRPGRHPDNWTHAHGNSTPLVGIVETGPDELSIYWLENYGEAPHIRRGTLRLDGFVSIHAGFPAGEFTTKPLSFTGDELVLNYATSAAGMMRVELLGPDGSPIPGFGIDDCDAIFGDQLARVVTWRGRSDLPKVNGAPLRLRFVMRDADVYALRFR